MVVVAYSDFEDEPLDLEIGFGLTREHRKPVLLPNRAAMSMTELPGVETLATVVRRGPNYQSHLAFGALGLWMEANGYAIAGPTPRSFSRAADPAAGEDEAVVEIQFPVTKAA